MDQKISCKSIYCQNYHQKCHEKFITVIHVFSRYAFANPVFNPTTVNTAKVILQIMKKICLFTYIQHNRQRKRFRFQSNTRSSRNTRHNFETCNNKTCTNHWGPRTGPCLNQDFLKMASGEHRKQWHKFLPFAILNYNSIYHFSIDFQPSRVFHGRAPQNILHHKFRLSFNAKIAPITDFEDEILRRIKVLSDKSEKNVMQSDIKYKK